MRVQAPRLGLRVTCWPVPAWLNCHSPSFTQVPPLLVPACWVWSMPATWRALSMRLHPLVTTAQAGSGHQEPVAVGGTRATPSPPLHVLAHGAGALGSAAGQEPEAS